MANAGQSQATGPLFFLKTGCPTGQPLISGTVYMYFFSVLTKENINE